MVKDVTLNYLKVLDDKFGYDHDIIQTFIVDQGEILEIAPGDSKILFIRNGRVNFSMSKYYEKELDRNQMLVIPLGSNFTGVAQERAEMVLLKIPYNINLSGCFQGQKSRTVSNMASAYSHKELNEKKQSSDELSVLDMNNLLILYVSLLSQCSDAGLCTPQYMEIKVQEFICIMNISYTSQQIENFFKPILSSDRVFSDFIYNAYRKVKTEQDLADLAYYSLSGFKKRFKKVFNMAPAQWLKMKKAEDIYYELNHGQKSFKQICEEYNFSSTSHFNTFCKKYLGATPGIIRSSGAVR